MTGGLKIWIEASRPKTLAAAVVPVLVGTAFAGAAHSAQLLIALVCLAFAVLVQIGTNFANDYFDFVQGADTAERVGPRRAVSAGLVAPRTMLIATSITLLAAFVIGLFLIKEGGWWLLPVGILSIVCALAYTGGPYPLGYNGLGDVFVFVFFGLVAVIATYFVQTHQVTIDVIGAACSVGLLSTNILVANNYRDAETDAKAGKRTLVVRLGRRFALWQYALSALGALMWPAVLFVRGWSWQVLLPIVLTPWALRLTKRLQQSVLATEQIALLGATARLLAAYGLLLSAGILWAAN